MTNSHMTTAIALWLCPKPGSQIHETLTSLISSLSPLFPTSPALEPHITITSQLAINSPTDVETVLKGSLAALREFKLSILFNSMVVNDKNPYFKKVYIRCDKSKNLVSFSTIIREFYVELPQLKDELQAKYKAQEWASDVLDPHISLIYTDLPHFDNALIRTMSTRVSDYLNCDDSFNVNVSDTLVDLGLGWSGGVLKIVRCEGPVEEWEVLGSADIH
jgi:2',3'-cyclic-nucleotide 3'-phosphodiesterase